MEIIKSQEEFDILASQQCEINNGNSSDECTENWKAGYLYALQQLENFMDSQNYDGDYDFFNKIENKLNELYYLSVV